jgi:hypothetical protein
MLVNMCMKCDGYSDDQIARKLELTILTNGWAVRGVEPSDDPDATLAGGWAFTIGATESFGLPELIITEFEFPEAHYILNGAVEFLRYGGTLDGLVDDHILWAPVHDDHLTTDLFNSYWDHYREPPKPGQMLQLFPSTSDHCAECVRARCTDLSIGRGAIAA